MTVAELIAELQKYPGNTLVVQSQWNRGGRDGFEETKFVELGRYSDGEFGLLELTSELVEEGYSEEDVGVGPPTVCIWP